MGRCFSGALSLPVSLAVINNWSSASLYVKWLQQTLTNTEYPVQMKDYLTHSSSNLNIEKWAFERVDAAAEAIKNYLSFKSAIDGRKLVKTQQTNSALSHLSLPIPSTETAALYKTRSAKENKGLWLLLCNLGIFVMIGVHLCCLLKGKLNFCWGSRWIH